MPARPAGTWRTRAARRRVVRSPHLRPPDEGSNPTDDGGNQPDEGGNPRAIRWTIRWTISGPSVVAIKEQSITVKSHQEPSPHLESPLAVLNPHSLGWVQRGGLERFHQGAAGELVESAHAFIQRQDCPSERVRPGAYGSSVRGDLMREAIGAH